MKKLILVAATLVLNACGGSSPVYQAAGGPNSAGYFAAPTSDGRYAVTYTGSKKMSAAQVAEFALLRAAELTSSSGKQWFAVLESTSRQVQVGEANDLDARAGPVLGGGGTSATAGGGGDRSTATSGIGDGGVPGGPSIGGFGGGDVPYQVVERWTPQTVHQTTLIIQMGSGNQAAFEGLTSAPEIFSAQDVATDIRAKMEK